MEDSQIVIYVGLLFTHRGASNQPEYGDDSWSPLLSRDLSKNTLHRKPDSQFQLCLTIDGAQKAVMCVLIDTFLLSG